MRRLVKIPVPAGLLTYTDVLQGALKLSNWCRDQGLKHDIDYNWGMGYSYNSRANREITHIHFLFEEQAEGYAVLLVLKGFPND